MPFFDPSRLTPSTTITTTTTTTTSSSSSTPISTSSTTTAPTSSLDYQQYSFLQPPFDEEQESDDRHHPLLLLLHPPQSVSLDQQLTTTSNIPYSSSESDSDLNLLDSFQLDLNSQLTPTSLEPYSPSSSHHHPNLFSSSSSCSDPLPSSLPSTFLPPSTPSNLDQPPDRQPAAKIGNSDRMSSSHQPPAHDHPPSATTTHPFDRYSPLLIGSLDHRPSDSNDDDDDDDDDSESHQLEGHRQPHRCGDGGREFASIDPRIPFKNRGGSTRIGRPIEPIQGPPPPILLKAKGPWHKDEDTALIYWVSHLGTGKWVEIAKRVGSRTGKQCRERWTNQLSPDIDHSAFRHEEDLMIITMQQSLQANKWCEVAKYLPGRPENAIKNRWNSRDLQRKRNQLRANLAASSATPISLILQNSFHPPLPAAAADHRLESPHEIETPGSIARGHRSPGNPNQLTRPASPTPTIGAPTTTNAQPRFSPNPGLPYPIPRNPSGGGHHNKRHRLVIEPYPTTVHRNHPGNLDSSGSGSGGGRSGRSSSSSSSSGSSSSTSKLPSTLEKNHPLFSNQLVGSRHAAIESSHHHPLAPVHPSQEWMGYRHQTTTATTTPPSTCSSSNYPRFPSLQARNQHEFGSGFAHYYSTPNQSPTYLLDSSSSNSLVSSEASDSRYPCPHYSSSSYDELPTPKSAPGLGSGFDPQPLFLGTQLDEKSTNGYYHSYLPLESHHDQDRRVPIEFEFGCPKQTDYDILLGKPASNPGASRYPSMTTRVAKNQPFDRNQPSALGPMQFNQEHRCEDSLTLSDPPRIPSDKVAGLSGEGGGETSSNKSFRTTTERMSLNLSDRLDSIDREGPSSKEDLGLIVRLDESLNELGVSQEETDVSSRHGPQHRHQNQWPITPIMDYHHHGQQPRQQQQTLRIEDHHDDRRPSSSSPQLHYHHGSNGFGRAQSSLPML